MDADCRNSGSPQAAGDEFCRNRRNRPSFTASLAAIRGGTRFGLTASMETGATARVDTAALIRRYDRPGPRYTSYPTAVEFNERFDEGAYRARLTAAAALLELPLSLYVHIPFCAERCTYCGCMMIATSSRAIVQRYLDYLGREIGMLAAHLNGRRRITQLHWGGGTPTHLPIESIQWLHDVVTRHFELEPGAEQAIEIDPRVTTREQLSLLRTLGFTRLSMGVQDFDPAVQEAMGRRQSEDLTRDLYEFARSRGFHSVNLDLVYGLPQQTLNTFQRTLQSVVEMRPDRVAVYSYAHVPWLRPHQKRIDTTQLPGAGLKFELLGAAVDAFTNAGYLAIGMDHFARPDDDLAAAAREHRLHRNFMGYTTRPATDMIGAGVSAIGDLQGAYAQNFKKLTTYYAALAEGIFPIERGCALTHDDRLRRHVITELMCNFRVDRASVADIFDVDFDHYFACELEALQAPGGPAGDGFVTVTGRGLEVTPSGRLFVRSICMAFDRYLAGHQGAPVFSRTI